MPAAPPLTTPTAHAGALHPDTRPGTVAVAQKVRERWHERCYPVAELPDVLPYLAGQSDVYISHGRFWGRRRIARLAELGALALDIDYHRRPELRGMHPLGVLEDALQLLERRQLPAPALAIGSGRGLHLLWLHTPVPRAALPRWSSCQRALWEALRPLGADRGALDAARVLRLVGTRHSKAKVLVECLRGPGDVWGFEDLAGEILPVDRGELADIRIQRSLRAARRPQERLWTPPEGYTAGTLWEARLSDLQTLRELRWFGELPPGQRDHWMFVAGVAMSWLAIPAALQRELYDLARQAASWQEPEARSRLQAVMQRARMAAKGERVDHEGLRVDPRYRFRSETVLELLEVTPEEERQMRTLISADERRRRDRERDEKRRRAAGAVSREEYLAPARQRRQEAHRLRSEGLSIRAIAARLEVSAGEAHRLLSASPEPGVQGPSGCMVAEPSLKGTQAGHVPAPLPWPEPACAGQLQLSYAAGVVG